MKKRILSAFIAIMMLIGMIPLSASASNTTISEIVFELEEMPAPGVTLDFPSVVSVNGSEDNINLVSVDINDWYYCDEYSLLNPETQLYPQDTFQSGYAYDLYMRIIPESGYQIASDCTFTLKLPEYETEKGYIYTQNSSYTDIDFYFNLTGVQPKISSILLELDHAPEAGGDPNTLVPTVISVDGDPLAAHLIDIFHTSWYWYNPEIGGFDVEDQAFQEGIEYQLNADIYAAGDYVFDEDISFSVQVGDDTRVGFVDETWTPWNYLFCLDFPIHEDTPIESVTLATEELPMAGNTPFDFSVYSVNGDPREVGAVDFTNGWGIWDATEEVYLPNGLIPFEAGEKYTATIFLEPADGYAFAPDCDVTVMGPNGELPFNCDYVDRSEISGAVPYGVIPAPKTFSDVKATDFYKAPVDWAVANNVTTGTTATTFGPHEECIRAQVATFLWRAAGCPEPASSRNPFVDVKTSDYFYKAVLWAAEQGITTGTDATHFSPFETCTRSQIVTFLWRAAGRPEPNSRVSRFVDVKTSDYFFKAVLWAGDNRITTGTDATHFAPFETCTRAQTVTFLYRMMG